MTEIIVDVKFICFEYIRIWKNIRRRLVTIKNSKNVTLSSSKGI